MDRRRREPLPPPIHQKPRRQLKIIDPNGDFCLFWKQIFFVTSFVGLFIDPLFLFLFLPQIRNSKCMGADISTLGLPLITFRNVFDMWSLVQIYMKFHTAFVSRTSRLSGKRELVLDPRKIAIRYLKTDFAIDLVTILPLPQILILVILPGRGLRRRSTANHAITLVIMLQYVPKLLKKGGMDSHCAPSLVVVVSIAP
nr:probable cyclic nucleotide-gated ion channel 16 [Ipomoea batatas]